MCRADISLFTLQWSEDSQYPRADFSQEHECVNFDAIFQWAGDRRVDAGKPGLLVHPKFGEAPIDRMVKRHARKTLLMLPSPGVAYPNGISSKIGGSEDMSPSIVED